MIRIAIQTKGRLNEESVALLREIGIKIEEAKRKFLSKSKNFPLEVLYLRDDDIPGVVARGTAQLGIVGLNEVAEKGYKVDIAARLGFGGCRISLAIPKAEEYKGVEYFNGKSIATSYPNILNAFLKEKGVQAETEVCLMVHKPAGVVTATEDKRLPTVMDLLPEKYRRRKIGPVGRLDRDVTGLVIMTTDGELAHRLISPKWKAEKTYRAVCEGRLNSSVAEAFAKGVELSDFTARPAQLEILEANDESSVALVTLTEGKFHQVKRMFAACGHPLVRLERLRIGCVALDPDLPEGGFRPLTQNEIDGLRALTGLNPNGGTP